MFVLMWQPQGAFPAPLVVEAKQAIKMTLEDYKKKYHVMAVLT